MVLKPPPPAAGAAAWPAPSAKSSPALLLPAATPQQELRDERTFRSDQARAGISMSQQKRRKPRQPFSFLEGERRASLAHDRAANKHHHKQAIAPSFGTAVSVTRMGGFGARNVAMAAQGGGGGERSTSGAREPDGSGDTKSSQ